MKKNIPLQQININHRALPVFADRSITASQVASLPDKSDKKKAARKEGTIRIIFLDSVSNSSVADVVMTSIAAEQLIGGIRQSLEKLRQDVKSVTIQMPPLPEEKPQNYIG